MFDCVMPTRNGRHGMAFTRFGQINLRNARHADDPRPLDEESPWPAARDCSRAYLHDNVISYLWTCDTCGYGFVTKHSIKRFACN